MNVEKEQALHDLAELGFHGRNIYLAELGLEMRDEMLSWDQAVAAVGGRPVWESREMDWLQTIDDELTGGS